VEEVEPLVRSAAAEYESYPVWRSVLAHMEAHLGCPAPHAAFEALAADDFSAVPFDEEWLVSLSMLAEVARVHRDDQRSAVLYERLAPYGDHVAIGFPEVSLGAVSRYLGILATTMSRWDDAAVQFEAALEMNERVEARGWLAHTLHDYGLMLLARDEGDPLGLERLAQAEEAYRALGMDHWTARAAAARASAGGVRLG
jgi:hypothetical protein